MSSSATAPSASVQSRMWSHAIWIGPLLVLFGAISYFTVFARYPTLRDVPWVNLPIILTGLVVSAVGLWKILPRPGAYGRKVFAAISFVLALTVALLFNFYVFIFSYSLPEPTGATLALGRAPDFELTDQDDQTFRLAALRGSRVVLVFYRGFW